MEYKLLLKIKENQKEYEYLHSNSYWYITLNRNSNYYTLFRDNYKKFKKEKTYNDIDNMIDNVETISTLINLK